MGKKSVTRPPLTKDEKILVESDKLARLFWLTGIRRCELGEMLNAERIGDAWNLLGKGKKYRYIPFSNEIEDLMTELKDRWSRVKNVRSINQHFEQLSKNVGSKITPHRMRATFATDLLENGVDLVSVQTLMGHSHISTTARYIIVSFNRLKVAMQTLTNKELSIEGLTTFEMQQEILRLRSINMRLKCDLDIAKNSLN